MARTEIVTITNMCMIYSDAKVLVQEKINDDYGFVHTGLKKFDHLPFTSGYLEWRGE